MSTLTFRKPRLPTHYYVFSEPPDSKGDEALHFVSERRRIVLKGHSFREFEQYVIPLLDGKHTVEQIETETADVFRPQDLEAGLELLTTQGLLEDGPGSGDLALEPQRNFFHEVSPESREAEEKLARATITVFGLGGVGAAAALGLVAARPGALRCIDAALVAPADTYLSQVLDSADVGLPRVEAVRRKIESTAPSVPVTTHSAPLDSDAAIAAAIQGSDFVVCCLDAGQSALIYKLNRVCLAQGIRWSSCSASGLEVVIGPTVHPFETACYLCYKMRAVACAEDPEQDFAFQRMLDARKRDDSGRRENLNFAAGIAANMLGLEALKEASGVMPASTVGKIIVIDLVDMSMKKHVVLRKPWCPACFAQAQRENAAATASADT